MAGEGHMALMEPDSTTRLPSARIPRTPLWKSASPWELEGDKAPMGLQQVAACHSSLTGPISPRRCDPAFPGQMAPDHLCFVVL